MPASFFGLEKYIVTKHHLSPFSKYLREIVYGGNDGIVTTFAVVAGFTGAQAQSMMQLPVLAVLLFGFANLAADAVSMALGNFLSTQSEQDVYAREKQKELKEIRNNPAMEEQESLEILKRKGFTAIQSRQLVAIYKTNTPYWLDFMMEKELEMPNPQGDHAGAMAFATFVSFIGFGCIPLLPYVFFSGSSNLFTISCLATITALCLVGILRWQVTNQHPARSIGETIALGGTAAMVAYLVGTFFRI